MIDGNEQPNSLLQNDAFLKPAVGLLLILTVLPLRVDAQGPPSPGTPVVITEGQGMATLTGRQNQVISTVLYPDPNDPEHAIDPRTGRNFHWDPDKKAWVNSQTGESVNVSGCLCSAPPAATSPTSTTPKPPNQPAPNNPVSMSGFTPTIQLRGFGGASFINGNTPANAGFDGAVLFPLGNRVLVGPTAGSSGLTAPL